MTDPKTKKLTIKQKKFVKEYIKNDGNGRDAAKAVYDVANENTAAAIASQNLKKVNVKEAIEQALAKHEITMDAAIKPIADGLKATRTLTADESSIELVDHATRLKASGMALKLLGAEQKDDSGGNTFNFINGNANFNAGNYKK